MTNDSHTHVEEILRSPNHEDFVYIYQAAVTGDGANVCGYLNNATAVKSPLCGHFAISPLCVRLPKIAFVRLLLLPLVPRT